MRKIRACAQALAKRETSAKEIEKFQEKPLDNKQILCYNKDVPRGDKELTLRMGFAQC